MTSDNDAAKVILNISSAASSHMGESFQDYS